ncbi:LLM class F420-dependent oxidoreductase [Amycolatopsis plumensis]|uniref:LLM class F420-dependent oxidoreductase n=1 Tax=Amycolatopsis plumensis TaxID=236508 RepID=A0ABV5U6S7_9PSEU
MTASSRSRAPIPLDESDFIGQNMRMDIGIAVYSGCEGLTPPELGRAVEERGFESLFWTEHTHIPVHSRRSSGGSPRGYAETIDPFVALAAVAAVTSTITLGTAVCLVTQRDPITTAKEVASLDQLSGGRFQFGVGAGWNRMEMANHGTDPRIRMALLADRVRAMREIWTAEQAEYHGEFVDFDPIWSWPKPVQKPHPPVLVGGNGPGSEERVLAFGDAWLPQADMMDVDELVRRASALRSRAADVGRGPVPITLFGAIAEDGRMPESGRLEAYAEAGVNRSLFTLQYRSAKDALSTLDKWTKFLSL